MLPLLADSRLPLLSSLLLLLLLLVMLMVLQRRLLDCRRRGEHGRQAPLLVFGTKLCGIGVVVDAKWVVGFSKIFDSGLERINERR